MRGRRARPGVHAAPLLAHPRRARLHGIVQAAPGIRFRDVRVETGWALGVLAYHLDVLEDAGLVVAHRRRGMTCYTTPGSRRPGPLVSRRDSALLALLAERGQVRLRDAATRMGRDRRDVSRSAARLVERGLAVRKVVGRAVYLRPVAPSDARFMSRPAGLGA